MKHTEEYKWSYSRTNSKGEIKFRHDTNETFEDVIEYLEERNIEYEVKEGAYMLWVHHENRKYAYYYTTGKWAAYSKIGRPKLHYSSKGIKDFLERFVLPVRETPDFNKMRQDVDDMILDDIKQAGPSGTTQRKIKEKYEDLSNWNIHAIAGSFSRLAANGDIFYNGDKEGRSKIMRHKTYKDGEYKIGSNGSEAD